MISKKRIQGLSDTQYNSTKEVAETILKKMEYNSLSMLYGGDAENLKRVSCTASINALRLMKLMNCGLTTKRRNAVKDGLHEGLRVPNESVYLTCRHRFDLNHISFEKQLKLYEQSKKYAPNKSFEPIIHVPMGKFIRQHMTTKNAYSPCLIYSKSNLLNKNIVVCKNKFTKTPRAATRNKLSQSLGLLSIKKLSSSQIDKIDDISHQAEEQLNEFKKDIARNETVKTLKTAKITHSKSYVDIGRLREEFNFRKDSSCKINHSKMIKDNYDKVKVCLDNKSRSFLKGVLNQIEFEDDKLKRPVIVDYSLDSYYLNNRLKREFALVRNETIKMKREFKGDVRINNDKQDVNEIKKLIKGMICRNIKGDDFLEDLIKRKNILRFKNFNYPERMFLARQKKKKHVPK